ncbi:hypothetical protein AVEN_110594-1 [Araneus ventricosus]|uniref:Uncharacterized protein n=1 Tax=Araneus ventricosus TaxID=182803 RepID=A0A4Y2TI66_ARAVE|nr:hypothetical protein AVEN_110594-1 [Araneus ventricosus]
MTRTTPELAPPSPNFHATPTGGRFTTTYDLMCNRPHTRRFFSGIGFRAWNPSAQSRDLTTRPPRPISGRSKTWRFVKISSLNFFDDYNPFSLYTSHTRN